MRRILLVLTAAAAAAALCLPAATPGLLAGRISADGPIACCPE